MTQKKQMLLHMNTIEQAIRFHKVLEKQAKDKNKPMVATVARKSRKKIVRELARLDQLLKEQEKC